MNSYTDLNNGNGRGAHSAPPQSRPGFTNTRTKISFDPPRVPVCLTPEIVPTRSVDGRNGPQYMWFFKGDQVAWFDPDFHQEICACIETTGCRDIAITKHVRKGTPPRFEVQPIAEETGEPAARPAPAQTAARRIEEIRKGAPPRFHHEEPVERETAPPCNQMSAALMEAMLAVHEVLAIATAHGMPWKPSSEDIRALAITIYIQSNGGRK